MMRRYATSVVLCKRIDSWNNTIQEQLGLVEAQNENEAKGRAVTEAMTNNPGYAIIIISALEVT